LVILLIGMAGCRPVVERGKESRLEPILPPSSEVQQRLDATLQDTFGHRRLSIEEHAAWQILHGVLAYQREFLVAQDGELVSAVEYLLSGGEMRGWDVGPGIELQDGRRGLLAALDLGSKVGQGHHDQWLANLAQCDLQPTQEIRVGDETYTMADFVQQAQWDVPRNVEREYSWTLIGLTTYLPTDATWTAQDGQLWSIERLLEIELQHDLDRSPCGGTHRLIGMTMALNRHLASEGTLSGVWQQADDTIQRAIEQARLLQNADGSFSTNYFARPGTSPDLAQNLGATGHVLEFLTLAMTDEQLREPWVQRAALYQCGLLDSTRDLPLECGALYHAVHGLVLYRERLFGRRSYLAAAGHSG